MALNINGTTGISGVDGSVSAPALTGTDSNTGITFPSADTIKFSTGGVERMAITNSGITGISGGKFSSYAIICDQKGSNVDGGTFTSGDWRHRDLNTEISDSDGIVSISSNLFTLQAGTYLILASATGFMVGRHQIRLYNNTDSAVAAYGSSEYSNGSHHMGTRSFLQTRIVISGAKAFKIEHRSENTVNTEGFGVANDWSSFNQFAQVEIYKES